MALWHFAELLKLNPSIRDTRVETSLDRTLYDTVVVRAVHTRMTAILTRSFKLESSREGSRRSQHTRR